MDMICEPIQRPKWDIDRILERLVGQQVRVAARSFYPVRPVRPLPPLEPSEDRRSPVPLRGERAEAGEQEAPSRSGLNSCRCQRAESRAPTAPAGM